MKYLVEYLDIWFSVSYWKINDGAISFEIYRIQSQSDRVFYRSKVNCSNVTSISEAELFAQGDLRFDGCANINFDECQHFCGLEMFDQFNDCIKRIYDLKSKLIGD